MADLTKEDTVLFQTRPCVHCRIAELVTLPRTEYEAWRGGAFVQDAFPNMSADERELLISGTHPGCWAELFAGEEV